MSQGKEKQEKYPSVCVCVRGSTKGHLRNLAVFMTHSRHSDAFVEGPNNLLTSQVTVPGAQLGI